MFCHIRYVIMMKLNCVCLYNCIMYIQVPLVELRSDARDYMLGGLLIHL